VNSRAASAHGKWLNKQQEAALKGPHQELEGPFGAPRILARILVSVG